MGHSLGGYTALNLVHERSKLHKAVILSGFLSIKSLLSSSIKSSFVVSRILKYEKNVEPYYSTLDNIEYLKETEDKIFFIQSNDDPIVPFSSSFEVVKEINNPNIKMMEMKNRFHNPNYTEDAVKYLNDTFGEYNNLIKQKKIKTDEDKINFFKDVSLERLTNQDEKVFDEIIDFIEKY